MQQFTGEKQKDVQSVQVSFILQMAAKQRTELKFFWLHTLMKGVVLRNWEENHN